MSTVDEPEIVNEMRESSPAEEKKVDSAALSPPSPPSKEDGEEVEVNHIPRSGSVAKEVKEKEGKEKQENGGLGKEKEERQKQDKKRDSKEKETVEEKPDPPKTSVEPLMSQSTAAAERPKAALRSAALRPVSARPSAPRRRDRNVQQIVHHEGLIQSNENAYEKKKDIIAELDDSDNIIIADIMQATESDSDANPAANSEINADGKQGHLVQQILETQQTLTKIDGNDGGGGKTTVNF